MEFEGHSSSSEDENDSDAELQEAYSKGLLKPGLNVEVKPTVKRVNNAVQLKQKLQQTKLNLPWIERLDMINELALMAPEMAVQFEKHEQKRSSLFAGNAKIKSFTPEQDPVLNDFKREMQFYRQAQSAVIEGMKRLHDMDIKTKRPDDYFAEMAKSDEHMQKVRANLMAKQEGQAKSERIKQIREQRKMGKMIQKQARAHRDAEKRDMLEKLKKFRKGKLKNLDFLNDASEGKRPGLKRKDRDSRFGFGGKKRGLKRNTKQSSMESEYRPGKKRGAGAGSSGKAVAKGGNRMGKNKRIKAKSRGRK